MTFKTLDMRNCFNCLPFVLGLKINSKSGFNKAKGLFEFKHNFVVTCLEEQTLFEPISKQIFEQTVVYKANMGLRLD